MVMSPAIFSWGYGPCRAFSSPSIQRSLWDYLPFDIIPFLVALLSYGGALLLLALCPGALTS